MNSLGPVFFSRTPAPSEPTDRPRRGATVPPDPSAPSLCPLSGGDDQQVLLWDAFSRCAPPCAPGDPPTARPPRARAPRPVKALLGHAGIILCAAWDTPAGAGIVSCDSDGMARPRRRRGEGGGLNPSPPWSGDHPSRRGVSPPLRFPCLTNLCPLHPLSPPGVRRRGGPICLFDVEHGTHPTAVYAEHDDSVQKVPALCPYTTLVPRLRGGGVRMGPKPLRTGWMTVDLNPGGGGCLPGPRPAPSGDVPAWGWVRPLHLRELRLHRSPLGLPRPR